MPDDIIAWLDRQKALTGMSKAEIIRHAVRSVMNQDIHDSIGEDNEPSAEDVLRAIKFYMDNL